MNWFWINIPAALVFVGLWSGIPMWLVLKRPDRGPESLAVQAPRPGSARLRLPSRRSWRSRSAASSRWACDRNQGGEMTAVVSRGRAKATWLSGVADLVILAVAFVMMACAAPSLAHPGPHGATAQSASVYTSSLITGSRSARWTGRAGQGRRAG